MTKEDKSEKALNPELEPLKSLYDLMLVVTGTIAAGAVMEVIVGIPRVPSILLSSAVVITYSIQYRRGMCDLWRSDGLGDADGWPTQEAARACNIPICRKPCTASAAAPA